MHACTLTRKRVQCGMASTFRTRVFESDATDDQRQAYEDVCESLAFDPLEPEELDSGDVVLLAFRITRGERRKLGQLSRSMGLTQNALLVTAVRLGSEAMREAIELQE